MNTNTEDGSWQLPDSPLLKIESTAAAGRTVTAKQSIAAAKDVYFTSLQYSPIAHMILQSYRREVCAECFAYDRGRPWGHRALWATAGVAFCSEICLDEWMRRMGDNGVAAHEAVEDIVKQQARRRMKRQEQDEAANSGPNLVQDASLPSSDDIAKAIESYRMSGKELTIIRLKTDLSKKEHRIVEEAINGHEVETDTLRILLSITIHASLESRGAIPDGTRELDPPQSLLSLVDDPHIYISKAAVADVCRAYLTLVAILPLPLLPYVSIRLCHELVSRASHNAFSIRPSGVTDGERSGEFIGWGIWPEASFFNHSCAPNVEKRRDGRRWRFWTKADVADGDQLCITYLGGDEDDLNVVERRRRLHDHWGFWCHCNRCMREDAGSTKPETTGEDGS